MKKRSLTFSYLKSHKVFFLILWIGLTALCTLLYGLVLFHPWKIVEIQDSLEVHIQRGMTPAAIAQLMRQEGVIDNERLFLVAAKLMGVTRKLQAGRYTFEGQHSNYSVIRKLRKGRVILSRITIPEGSRATAIAGLVSSTFGVDSTEFITLVFDSTFCRSRGIEAPSLEGYLYPDTYLFNLDPTAGEILDRMIRQFKAEVGDTLRARAEALQLTLHEALTLASIIEGEAAMAGERRTISALYHNRLRRRMRLQADPTIQYIIPDGPRRLLYKDLEIDSPYNTYRNSGLPPGPVNNPGIASIRAALNPTAEDYLFMVANGDGSHTFSRTEREHNIARRRFDQVRRDVRRQNRNP